jgi:TolB-like protein/Tfp pilus assembly protein PilF
MKRCPECRRDYHDDSLLYCLEDGTALVQGSVPSPNESQAAILSEPPASVGGQSDEAQTAILHSTGAAGGQPSGDNPTQPFIHTTAAVEPRGSMGDLSEKHSFSAHRAAKPRRHLDKRLLLAPLALAVIVLGGFFGYRYFNLSNSGTINSIAVLPFENRSGNADTDYLSDGLSDSLIYRLTQLPNLKVSPTSSVIRYKDKQMDVSEIAKELDVDAVMSGKLAQRGDDLTISVELVDARTKKLIWAEQYDRKMADLLATQREIATKITEKLQLNLAGNEKGITKKYTNSNDAYQLYMRGRYSFAKRTKDEMLRSIDYFQQAVKIDPEFALAWARISEVYGSMPAYPYLSPKEAFPQAKAAAEKALEIDPTLSEAYTFLAYAQIIYDWNWTDGERSFKRAIELDPNNMSAHFRYGQIYLMPVGRFDEGINEMNQGLNAESLDVNMGVSVAWGYLLKGERESALELARKTYDLEPNHPLSRWMLSQALTDMGRYDESLAISEKTLQEDPNNQFAIRDAGFAYAQAGRRDKAEQMINRFRELAKTQYVPNYRIAAIYGALGDKDKAFAELEKAFEAKDWELFRLKIEFYMRPLRDDPRLAAMIKRLNVPE